MNGRLFTLVDACDVEDIFAWGMEVTHEDRTEAVVYRADPVTKQGMFGLHASANAARRRYSRTREYPLAVIWEDDFSEPSPPDDLDALEARGHPRF